VHDSLHKGIPLTAARDVTASLAWLHMHSGCFPKTIRIFLQSKYAVTLTGVITRSLNIEILTLNTEKWAGIG